jgi:hypothetical protein
LKGGTEELVQTIGDSLKFFDDVVVREQIYRLNLKRVQLLDEIRKQEEKKQVLDKKAARRNLVFFSSASLFFAA